MPVKPGSLDFVSYNHSKVEEHSGKGSQGYHYMLSLPSSVATFLIPQGIHLSLNKFIVL